MSLNSNELVVLGRTPIGAESACGVAVKYEPDFQALEDEIAKLGAISGESIDWRQVVELSSTIIKEQSKDLLVAAYLAQGLLSTEGVAGLTCGLQIIADMIDTYWQDMFPPAKRLRARSNALQWLSEHASLGLENLSVDQNNAPFIVDSFTNLKHILDVADEKFSQDAPGMIELNRCLKEANRAAKALVGDNGKAESAPEQKTVEVAAEASKAHVMDSPAQPVAAEKQELGDSITEAEVNTSVVEGHPMKDLGAACISDASPCGDSVKYEPDFELLDAELAKQESITAATIDWRLVCNLASNILQSQSKDLLVAAYLSMGLFETEGYRGLAVSLTVIRDMLNTHWDHFYPPAKRMRARGTALQWLSEKVDSRLEKTLPKPQDSLAVIECADLLGDILDIFDAKSEGDGPGMIEITRRLRDFKKAALYEKQKEKEEKTAPTPKTSEANAVVDPVVKSPQSTKPLNQANNNKASNTGSGKPNTATLNVAAVGSDNEAKKSLRAIQDATRNVSNFWLGSKISDPKSYRLNRVATWMMIDTLPPSKEGKTQLPVAPVADKKKQLQQLFDGGKFVELLPQLEQTLSRAPFWIDGQHMAAKALQGLGAEYADAYQTVIRELNSFLVRVNGIEALCFVDGTPFANDETRVWLGSEVMTSGDSRGVEEGEAPWSECYDEAMALLASGKQDEALALFQEGINGAPSGRLNWQWRFALVRLLHQAGKTSIIVPILKGLLTELVASELVSWDRGLAKNTALMLFQSSSALAEKNKNDESMLEVKNYAYGQLCQIDPLIAIQTVGH